MDTVAASHVKQNFGEVLARAANGPVGVERHRKLVAAIVPPQWLQQQRKRVDAALREVDRWEERALCSADYIQRWRAWLALPVKQLVQRMCSDAQGWGRAMRQNSPFTATGVAAVP